MKSDGLIGLVYGHVSCILHNAWCIYYRKVLKMFMLIRDRTQGFRKEKSCPSFSSSYLVFILIVTICGPCWSNIWFLCGWPFLNRLLWRGNR